MLLNGLKTGVAHLITKDTVYAHRKNGCILCMQSLRIKGASQNVVKEMEKVMLSYV